MTAARPEIAGDRRVVVKVGSSSLTTLPGGLDAARLSALVDVLAALNGGKPAVADLERAMTEILDCFRTGSNSLWSSLFAPRIDRIVFAATKADHLHHSSHDRLEAVLRRAVTRAVARAESTGAEIDVVALAAVSLGARWP